ncbi:MAG: PstS family phosphate ABC transporter substrate-binding protein [Candidatus Marinimicrobia bacterium]|nr:PstS family phosphate ABC transporter substrate-binding protein [Candidatus Neomarinimicrobiota bacterium]MCF7905473.1 PstS family phosphate ABC transporter substrate-binding protein [Candidatus Neomarinimicrobiota bacterium]
MFKKILVISLVALASSLILMSCAKKDSSDEPEVKYLTIKGSDTMVHLASEWAEAFMKKHADVDISVTGGGSGTGIAALLNGTTDICIASRKIKEKEETMAAEQGISPNEIVTSRDGIAVVVHPENSVDNLTIEQVGKIYTGAYTRWSDVGGPDQPIIILSRESSSGTYVFFQKRVMNKKDYSQDAMLMPSTSAIIQSVSQDKLAIGYVGLGYGVQAGDKVRMMSVKNDADSPAVAPSVASVQDASYGIARPLHFYTNGELTGVTKDFVDFVLSAEGQQIVLESGYVPIN